MRFLRAVLAMLALLAPAASCTPGLPTAPAVAEADPSLSGTGFLGGGTR